MLTGLRDASISSAVRDATAMLGFTGILVLFALCR